MTEKKQQPALYGGQAVIEGVMIRGRRTVALACRKPNGEIYRYREPLRSPLVRSRVARLPFVRGVVVLWESLDYGIRMLMRSAEVQLEQEEQLGKGGNTLIMGVALVGASKSALLVNVVARGGAFAEAAADVRAHVRRTIARFVERRTRLHALQYEATRLREKPMVWSLLIVLGANCLLAVVLFWTAWANPLGASVFATQDAHGPIRHGLVEITCSASQVLQQVIVANPQLSTITQLANLPPPSSICPKSQ